jgi:hypothetical protein
LHQVTGYFSRALDDPLAATIHPGFIIFPHDDIG